MDDQDTPKSELWAQFGEVIDEVDRRVHLAADAVERFVVPVLGMTEDGNPEFVGSGVLARLGCRHYLVSAAHVFDQCRLGVYLGHLGATDDTLERTVVLSGAKGAPRSADPYDIGCIELEPGEVDTVGHDGFVDLAYTLDAAPEPISMMIVVGYPIRDQVLDHDAQTMTTQSTLLVTGAPDDKAHGLLAINERTHVLLRYRKQDILYNRKTQGSPPPLNGMSGGGLWPVLLHADDVSVASPPFAGIFIERAASFKAAIIALRAPLIRAFISQVSRDP